MVYPMGLDKATCPTAAPTRDGRFGCCEEQVYLSAMCDQWRELLKSSSEGPKPPDQSAWDTAKKSVRAIVDVGMAGPKFLALATLVQSCTIAGLEAHALATTFPIRYEDAESSLSTFNAHRTAEYCFSERRQIWFEALVKLVHLDASVKAAMSLLEHCRERGWICDLERATPYTLIRAWKNGGGTPWASALNYSIEVGLQLWRPYLLGISVDGAWMYSPAIESTKHTLLWLAGKLTPLLFVRRTRYDGSGTIKDDMLSNCELRELRGACDCLEAILRASHARESSTEANMDDRSILSGDAASVSVSVRSAAAESTDESAGSALTANEQEVLKTMNLFDATRLVSIGCIVENMDATARLSDETVRQCVRKLIGSNLAERPEGDRSGARLTNGGRKLAGKIAD